MLRGSQVGWEDSIEGLCELQCCVVLTHSAPYTHRHLSLLSRDKLSYGIYVINAIMAADYCEVQGPPGSSSPPTHLSPAPSQMALPLGRTFSAERCVNWPLELSAWEDDWGGDERKTGKSHSDPSHLRGGCLTCMKCDCREIQTPVGRWDSWLLSFPHSDDSVRPAPLGAGFHGLLTEYYASWSDFLESNLSSLRNAPVILIQISSGCLGHTLSQ